MCFGGGGGDGGAAEARQAEQERQRKIRRASGKVAEIFGGPFNYEEEYTETIPGGVRTVSAGRSGTRKSRYPARTVTRYRPVSGQHEGEFTDDYYENIGDAFVDYYLPQARDQYRETQRKLAFAPSGTRSSSYARRAGRVGEAFERAKGDISDRALAAESGRRSEVENQRRQILAAVRAGAGAEEAAASASAAAKALRAPPVYEPIGDLFSRYLNTSANATIADNAGYPRSAMSLNTLFKPRKRSSVVTVG